jgi:hypothetical protein
MSPRTSSHTGRFLGLLAALALILLPGTAEAAHSLCTSAQVPEPFVLPDDSEHAAGSITLCKVRKHSPTRSLLVGYVDGHQVAMLLGTSGHNEIGSEALPFMLFARDADGRLRLYGYGVPEGNAVETFTLGRPDRLDPAAHRSIQGS